MTSNIRYVARDETAGLIDQQFTDSRQAALALLSSNQRLSRKAGQFLGQIVVDPSPLSEAQAAWLSKLLNRAGLPRLTEEGAP